MSLGYQLADVRGSGFVAALLISLGCLVRLVGPVDARRGTRPSEPAAGTGTAAPIGGPAR